MTFTRPPAIHDPAGPRASTWLAGGVEGRAPSDPGSPRLRVIGVPTSRGSIVPSQAWRTPTAVRLALERLTPWDAEAGRDLRVVDVHDMGDWPVELLEPAVACEAIHVRAATLDVGETHLFLGGDNLITRPLVAGMFDDGGLPDVGLLRFDTGHDARGLEEGPHNANVVRGLIADGLPADQVVQIGIGAFTDSAANAAWCEEQGITFLTADQTRAGGAAGVTSRALDRLSDRCTSIYVDVDLGVLDVAFAPACPGARPGGLSPSELLAAVRVCGSHPAVVGADLVEVDAAADQDGRTVMAAAMALLAFASGLSARPT